MSTYKDNFSQQATIYARYRPNYPTALFEFLSSLTEGHTAAWDCGTGNGQAATALAAYYEHVIATDPSEEQIRNAAPHERVTYRVEKAEATIIPSASVDLLTIANAMHWFDFDLFYTEVNRVVKPGGVIAAWCYAVPHVNEEIDKIAWHFHNDVVGKYWVEENRIVERRYGTIPFPFAAIPSPAFCSERMMDLDDFVAYLNTWSATQKFINEQGHNPTEQLKNELQAVWKSGMKKVTWELSMRVGRVVTT